MGFTAYPAAGDDLTAATLQALISELRPLVAYKTADETVTSSTTLQNDDHMTITLLANTVYVVRNVFMVTGDDAADMKVNYTVPSGTVGWMGQTALSAPTGVSTEHDVNMVAFPVSGTSLTFDLSIGIADTNFVLATVDGLMEVGGSGGSMTTRWAQKTSSGTGTTVKRGSFLMAQKVG